MTTRFIGLLALAASLVPGATALGEIPPQLLIPGTFHAGEVSAHSGERWLALVASGEGYALEETVIRISPAPAQEGTPGDRQVAVAGDRQPLLLVRGLPELTPGAVAAARQEPRELPVSGTLSLELPGAAGYTLEVTCDPAAAESADHFRDCALTLSSGGQTQSLAAFQVYSPPGETPAFASEARPALIWAGDLDRDGRLDLLLNLTDHYNVFAPVLFLSSRAGAGELLGRAASFTAYGC